MELMTLVDDPYPIPFEWAETMPVKRDEEWLFGLLPCGTQCEQGFLPLIDGSAITCPGCNEAGRWH